MYFSFYWLLAPLALLSFVEGKITQPQMEAFLNGDRTGLALLTNPMWMFGAPEVAFSLKKGCLPTWALMPDGSQKPAADRCAWPNAGCNCKVAPGDLETELFDLAVYYSIKQCNEHEVRIQYTLFFQKDGFNDVGGHGYDFEGVVVLWQRDRNYDWYPSYIKTSQHGDYPSTYWPDIPNTFYLSDIPSSAPHKPALGMSGKYYPIVFVAWAKHAIYLDSDTRFSDTLSQQLPHAYRTDDWNFFAERKDLIETAYNSQEFSAGLDIKNFNWGSASSDPITVHRELCSL